MPTIFTRARAAKKVIDLMDRECGIKRKGLRCETRLESDLGVVGDDTYELLQAMHEDLSVDMSAFDCRDRITPEGVPPYPMLLTILAMLPVTMGLLGVAPDLPQWVVIGMVLVVSFIILRVLHRLMVKPSPELTIRDLVLSVEAKRWVSPKQNARMEING